MANERLLSPEAANELIDLELENLHLKANLQTVTQGSMTSYLCQLIDTNTQELIERGFGKGNPIEAQLGAKFEALEHFTSIVSRFDIEHYYCSLEDLQNQKQQVIESKIPRQILKEAKYQQQKLVWLRYSNYCDQQISAFVPATSVDPFYLLNNKLSTDKFPYKEIYMQNNNNGVAIGTNRTEAFIHAISEVIERDALSFFLVDNFILPKSNKLQLIDLKTISNRNQEILKRLENELQLKAKLFYMPNDFNVPSFCAVIQAPYFIAPIQGFGTSLNAEYALYHAINECIEILNFYETITIHESRGALQNFAQIPSLLNCVNFDVEQIIDNKQFVTLDFNTIHTYNNLNLEIHLQELINRVLKGDFSLYYKVLYQSENVCTIHAIIPQAENLFNILKGVVPQFNKRISKKLL